MKLVACELRYDFKKADSYPNFLRETIYVVRYLSSSGYWQFSVQSWNASIASCRYRPVGPVKVGEWTKANAINAITISNLLPKVMLLCLIGFSFQVWVQVLVASKL
jgi:hypothetical protein